MAQAILLKHHIACTCGEFLVQLHRFPVFCVSVSRAMVRKGWSTLEVPDGWLKIVRGVRPPSEKWPRAGLQQQRIQTARSAPVKKPQAVSPQ